jgi:hypothetical protein
MYESVSIPNSSSGKSSSSLHQPSERADLRRDRRDRRPRQLEQLEVRQLEQLHRKRGHARGVRQLEPAHGFAIGGIWNRRVLGREHDTRQRLRLRGGDGVRDRGTHALDAFEHDEFAHDARDRQLEDLGHERGGVVADIRHDGDRAQESQVKVPRDARVLRELAEQARAVLDHVAVEPCAELRAPRLVAIVLGRRELIHERDQLALRIARAREHVGVDEVVRVVVGRLGDPSE